MEIKSGILVIADISGYTQFIKQYDKSLLHAETLITELINAVIKTSKHPLTVNKLEGDAVLFVCFVDESNQADVAMNILKQAETFFEKFKHKQRELLASSLCDCDACTNLDKLQLKIILHRGEILIKKIQHFEEIAGKEVIVVHRLLKNSINCREYILMTADYHQLCGDWQGKKPEFTSEHVDDVGDVNIVFYRLTPTNEPLPKKNKWKGIYNLMHLEWHRLLRTLGLQKTPSFTHLPKK